MSERDEEQNRTDDETQEDETDESGYDESVEGNGTHEEQAAEASLNTYVGEQS